MTYDMGQRTPLALDLDRRCQTPGAAQNTAEEVPHRGYCDDTANKGQGGISSAMSRKRPAVHDSSTEMLLTMYLFISVVY